MKHSDVLNAVCPYYTMFPLDLPLGVISKLSNRDLTVADPFCGRGTTNFAARLMGHRTLGMDVSPVATAIAKAKLADTTAEEVVREARIILGSDEVAIPSSEFWHWAFGPETLKSICKLRTNLLSECNSPVRIMLRAILMGALHGPLTKNEPSHLSNQSPRTFAPKPGYAVKFWKDRNLISREVDPISVIERRAKRFLSPAIPKPNGQIIQTDSRLVADLDIDTGIDMVITSPPYYGMRTYVPDQWLRNWFVGGPDHVDYAQPRGSIEHSSPEGFCAELHQVWSGLAEHANDNARLVIRIGGINDREADPKKFAKKSLSGSGWKISTIKNAGNASNGKRQATQFGEGGKGSARAEFDIYARIE